MPPRALAALAAQLAARLAPPEVGAHGARLSLAVSSVIGPSLSSWGSRPACPKPGSARESQSASHRLARSPRLSVGERSPRALAARAASGRARTRAPRSEEHTSELKSLMPISY